MHSTPPIPAWVREFRHSAYTNIWEMVPEETQLYGTETLYGDWDAELLLLLKDFDCAKVVRARLGGSRKPYSHKVGMATNRTLQRFADPLEIPLLYGSAAVGLLRNDGRTRGALPAWEAIRAYCVRVLEWVTDPAQTPRLRGIACMGRDAWNTAYGMFGVGPVEHANALRTGAPMVSGRLRLFALPHPVNPDWNRECGQRARAILQSWAAPEVGGHATPPTETALRTRHTPKAHPGSVSIPKEAAMPGTNAPDVTPSTRHDAVIKKFYGGTPMASEAPLDFPPIQSKNQPDPESGISVVIRILSRPGGSTYAEVWDALRAAGIHDRWNTAKKLNGTGPGNGLGLVRKYGYRLTYDPRTLKYRATRGG